MKLEQIGFYTLEDKRAKRTSTGSPLWRCELILTGKCNFSCPYCRGTDCNTISYSDAFAVVCGWCNMGLKNIRFSGGEPTLWPRLGELVSAAQAGGVQRIAISTNGSADLSTYHKLIGAGVNDLSISLDACCSSKMDKMAGREGSFYKVVDNIAKLSRRTYVTVGIVLTEENIHDASSIIKFAHDLGVADIRIITAAQFDKEKPDVEVSQEILDAHPILKYRIERLRIGEPMRGLTETDNHQCPLVLDDMAVMDGLHYPCIIYLRERGAPIGDVCANMRIERKQWNNSHDCFKDPICKKNCLDVCVDYNNKHRELKNGGG